MWAEWVGRTRRAAGTEPGRLRIIGALLAGLLLLLGAVTAYQVNARAEAADSVRRNGQEMSTAAAELFRSLARANTAAATGFLTGADQSGQSAAVRDAYDDDIATAGEQLAQVAADTDGTEQTREYVERMNRALPIYTGLVETARANDRLGFPLGGAYLRYADQQMNGTEDAEGILDWADSLYKLETERLRADLAHARKMPWAALGLGVVLLVGLAWVQRRHFLRTNRVLNPGLLAASAATLVLLGWLGGAHLVSRAANNDADRGAASSLQALNDAWATALNAHGIESLGLVARGGSNQFEDDFQDSMTTLLGGGLIRTCGPGEEPTRDGGASCFRCPEETAEPRVLGATAEEEQEGELYEAARLAQDAGSAASIEEAISTSRDWHALHRQARCAELDGDYAQAVDRVTAAEGSTGEMFVAVTRRLEVAAEKEQERFDAAVGRAHGALAGLAPGAGVLAALGVVGAGFGLGRRLSEYR